MQRIVHLDLKGAPLKIDYLKEVLKFAKIWGCTGVLLEWEDTFPYTGELEVIGSVGGCGGDDMYTMAEIKHIFDYLRNLELDIIQLVQTMGHMEFVLKHPEFSELRENNRTPSVLCPTNPQSLELVKKIIKQVLDAQPDAKYFHIGADEVWHLGICLECTKRVVSTNCKLSTLFLDHIKQVLLYVKKLRPNIVILMWDDMLRSIPLEELQSYNLGELVHPVVWNYNVMEHFNIDPNMWEVYKAIFPVVWAASAFKGANGCCQVQTQVSRYISNQRAWLAEMRSIDFSYRVIHFMGVVLTGWSRYDHYATLCELMPVAMPSLRYCLNYWKVLDENGDEIIASRETLRKEEWPGVRFAMCLQSFVALRERANTVVNGDQVATWLNPWQISRSFTNPIQTAAIANVSVNLVHELKELKLDLESHFAAVTGERSQKEWMESFFSPVYSKLDAINDVAVELSGKPASVRPAEIKPVED